MRNFFSNLFKRKTVDRSETSSKHTNAFNAYKEATEILKKYPKGGHDDEHLLSLLDKAIDGGFYELYSQRAFCLQALDYNHDAILDFDKAITASPNDANLYFGRGHSKKVLMQIDEAILDLEKAIMLAQANNELNTEYDDEMQKKGWKSVAQFYEFQLEDTRQRKKYLENENLKNALLQKQKNLRRNI